jgi:hypothetical protein
MNHHATLCADRCNFLKRLDCPSLVVRMHDGDNAGLLANQTGQKRRINDSGGIHREESDLETFKMLQVFGRMEDGMVLHSGNDDVFAQHGMGAGDAHQA